VRERFGIRRGVRTEGAVVSAGRWDLVVVGAGSAGAAYAARMAESGRRTLLLEAGRDWRPAELPREWRGLNPGLAIYDDRFEDWIWPQLTATRVRGQEPAIYYRGRGLGGSSTVNSFIAIRPTREDFEEWVADGCAGWSFDEVLPSFRRSETDLQFGDAPYHGDRGPVPVTRLPIAEWGSVDRALRAAALDHGFAWADDVNAPDATGVSPKPMNARDGARVTTNDGYLEPLRGDPRLEIRGGSLVDRVEFEGGRAIGVRLTTGELLRADRVVLSAGVVGTPGILQRSGIGPADALRGLGIDVRVDLPVGRGMSDHVMARVAIPLADGFQAHPEGRHVNCCVRYSSELDGLRNDMMIYSANQGQLTVNPDGSKTDVGAFWTWVNRAFATGSVEITTPDPLAMPRVFHDLLSDERDLRRLRDGMRLLAELAEHDSVLEASGGDVWGANVELRAALDGTDADLDAHLRATAVDTAHATGTCRMGAETDPRSVVRPDGTVLGVEALSVVDASILPHSPRANTHLVTVMVGEHLAARAG
jgi:choline dehydrogenase